MSHRSHAEVHRDAINAVAPLQVDLAKLLGVAPRTLQRNQGIPHYLWPVFFGHLYRANPALARELAAVRGTTLAQMGVDDTGAAAPPAKAHPLHADAVVLAAADAFNALPKDARSAVATLFARIKELGVDLPGLVDLLAAPAARKK